MRDAVSVVVPYRPDGGHRDALWSWVRHWWLCNFPEVELVVADSQPLEEPFNRGRARNSAARSAGGEILIVADADTLPQRDAVCEGIALVAAGDAPWALPYSEGRYYNLSAEATRQILKFEPDPTLPLGEPWDPDDWEFKLTSWAGCLIVPSDAYWAAGGYPEFLFWSYEDDCFRAALDVMAGPHHRVDGFCAHLWHPTSEADRFGNPGVAANKAIYDEYRRARSPRAMAAVIARHAPGR